MYQKCGYCIILVLLLQCLPVNSIQPERLPAPELRFVKLTFSPDIHQGVHEAIHLSWEGYTPGNLVPYSLTLLRKQHSDSLFVPFTSSRGIPSDTTEFYDFIDTYTFPETGYDTIFYRILAVDTSGYAGDTSDICAVILAPQPEIVALQIQQGCLIWESWVRGGVFSWCTLENEDNGQYWRSEEMLDFPLTDEPAEFRACMPGMTKGNWIYALFVKSHDAYSISTGVYTVE